MTLNTVHYFHKKSPSLTYDGVLNTFGKGLKYAFLDDSFIYIFVNVMGNTKKLTNAEYNQETNESRQ